MALLHPSASVSPTRPSSSDCQPIHDLLGLPSVTEHWLHNQKFETLADLLQSDAQAADSESDEIGGVGEGMVRYLQRSVKFYSFFRVVLRTLMYPLMWTIVMQSAQRINFKLEIRIVDCCV